MINLLFTLAGMVFLFLGLIGMYYGFTTPPNILSFLAGLVSFVLGLMAVILFAGKVDIGSLKKSPAAAAEAQEIKKVRPKRSMETVNAIKGDKKTVEPKKSIKPTRISPKKVSKNAKVSEGSSPQNISKTSAPSISDKATEGTKGDSDRSAKPVRKPRKFLKLPRRGKKDSEPMEVKEETPSSASEITPKATRRRPMNRPPKSSNDSKESEQNEIKEKPKVKPAKQQPNSPKPVKPVTSLPKKPKIESNIAPARPIKPSKSSDKNDTHYVKDRLNKLKQEYIENVDDVEDLIEERLDSFRGAINQIRSESKEPSIIWSFDASDVQEAMKDTILKANEKVIMMYPWIRNIDVGILKKFMDTKSRMIIQEAGLDDDASVELIKVLLDNNVQIRTMPHIHTVAVVSDDKNGLIISTDPIYESFEVGVIYKDEKSIMEIEKLFEEAWGLSKEIILENE